MIFKYTYFNTRIHYRMLSPSHSLANVLSNCHQVASQITYGPSPTNCRDKRTRTFQKTLSHRMIEDDIHNLDNEVGQNGSNVQQQQQQQQQQQHTSILERNNLTTVTELGNRSQVKFIMIVVATLLKVLF